MTKPAPFTEAEVRRVVRALKAVGETIRGVERTPEGGFVVLTGSAAEQQVLTPLEAWEREHGHRAA